MKKVAAIDIGTNSVLLTVVGLKPVHPSTGSGRTVEGSGRTEMRALYEAAEITRIGEGLSESNQFKHEAMDRTLAVIKKYNEICKKHSVEKIFVVGTAAMRKAENAGEFVKMVKKECSLDIEIISGEREAELSFKAVEKDFGPDVLVVDIGGGSTEFIFKENDEINMKSLELGGVTLHEEFAKSDPINENDFSSMSAEIKNRLKPVPAFKSGRKKSLVATAGTATTLGAMKLKLSQYNHAEIHGLVLKNNDIEKIIENLRSHTIEERKSIPGLEPKRADVIFPGALILKAVMEKFGFDKVTVSDRGVRWGLLYGELDKAHPSTSSG